MAAASAGDGERVARARVKVVVVVMDCPPRVNISHYTHHNFRSGSAFRRVITSRLLPGSRTLTSSFPLYLKPSSASSSSTRRLVPLSANT